MRRSFLAKGGRLLAGLAVVAAASAFPFSSALPKAAVVSESVVLLFLNTRPRPPGSTAAFAAATERALKEVDSLDREHSEILVGISTEGGVEFLPDEKFQSPSRDVVKAQLAKTLISAPEGFLLSRGLEKAGSLADGRRSQVSSSFRILLFCDGLGDPRFDSVSKITKLLHSLINPFQEGTASRDHPLFSRIDVFGYDVKDRELEELKDLARRGAGKFILLPAPGPSSSSKN